MVFGMPKEAIKLGGVDEVMALGAIPEAIVASRFLGHKARFPSPASALVDYSNSAAHATKNIS